MKRALLALCGLLLTFPAAAADKADVAAAPAAPAAMADGAPHFHGLYIGGAVGAASGQFRDADGFQIPREGLTASVLAGYNHRLPGLIVVGLEGDLGVTDISGSTAVDGFRIQGSSRWIGSLRARLGRPYGDVLLFVTGGLAATNGKIQIETFGAADTDRIVGTVYGAGIEAMLLGNMGARLEVLRYDWRGTAFTSDTLDTGRLRSHDVHARAGLVFRLN